MAIAELKENVERIEAEILRLASRYGKGSMEAKPFNLRMHDLASEYGDSIKRLNAARRR